MRVPYKGGGPAVQDVIAGHVVSASATVLEAGSAIRAGHLRPSAMTGTTRSPVPPGVPTPTESGVPGYDSISWIDPLAPAGTPAATVERVAADPHAVLDAPECASA